VGGQESLGATLAKAIAGPYCRRQAGEGKRWRINRIPLTAPFIFFDAMAFHPWDLCKGTGGTVAATVALERTNVQL